MAPRARVVREKRDISRGLWSDWGVGVTGRDTFGCIVGRRWLIGAFQVDGWLD